jgi:hypothetical protein
MICVEYNGLPGFETLRCRKHMIRDRKYFPLLFSNSTSIFEFDGRNKLWNQDVELMSKKPSTIFHKRMVIVCSGKPGALNACGYARSQRIP